MNEQYELSRMCDDGCPNPGSDSRGEQQEDVLFEPCVAPVPTKMYRVRRGLLEQLSNEEVETLRRVPAEERPMLLGRFPQRAAVESRMSL